MLYRLQKFAVGVAHLVLLWLLISLVLGRLDWTTACACLTVGGIWLILTLLQLRRLLAAYVDRISRLQILLPLATGILLASGCLVFAGPLYKIAAVVELLGWLAVYLLYRRRRQDYFIKGHGPLPHNAWVNPPAAALQEGDLILTDGRMARRTRNSVGHTELVYRGDDGKLMVFSAYIEKGVVIHTARALVAGQLKANEHFIVLRLRTPLTAEQNAAAAKIAEQMRSLNRAWKARENERRTRLFNSLPMPARLRKLLLTYGMSTGYDVWGKYIGGRRAERWTCMSADLEMLERLGVKMSEYGTGLLGLGTGILNPLVPIRLMSDPAYRLLTTQDEAAFKAKAGNA